MDRTVSPARRREQAWAVPSAWLRRADAVLARGAAVNAARAVAEEQARRRRWEREDVDVTRLLVPQQRVG